MLAVATQEARSERYVAEVSPIYQLDFTLLIVSMGVVARMIKGIWLTADLRF